MKLLIVIPYFYPKVGGLENYALAIAKGLQEKYRWEVVIVTTSTGNKEIIEEVQGLKIYRLPIFLKISNTPVSPFWQSKLEKIIVKEKPDVINGHTPVPFISDIAARVAEKLHIPFALTYQNDLVKENIILNAFISLYYMLLGEKTLSLSHTIIASSSYYAKNSRYLNKYSEKVAVVSPGVYLDRFAVSTMDKSKYKELQSKFYKKKVVLFIGQLDKTHAHKGLASLLSAFVEVLRKDANAHLLVIGKGDMIAQYKKLCANLHISDYVTFLGFVSDPDLPYYYHLADVVVLPSQNDSEGFGIVLIEAGASKKPVIASMVGGIPSVVNEGKTGILVPPKDTLALSIAILKILQNNAYAKKLGRKGYEKVKKDFTWETQLEKTHAILLGINT